MGEENDTVIGAPSDLVRINVDPADRIAQLYDISPKLAAEIVNSRSEVGPFRRPEDLARVHGISRNLALTLAPHIDWSEPKQPQGADEPDRDIGSAILPFFLLVAIVLASRRILESFSKSIMSNSYRESWTAIWINGSILWVELSVVILLAVAGFHSLSWIKHERHVRITRILFWITLAAAISTGLGNAFRYQFVLGWSVLLKNRSALSAGVAVAVIFIIFSPAIVNIWDSSKRLKRASNLVSLAATFVLSPIVTWWLWIERYTLPILVVIAMGIIGAGVTLTAVQSLRTGQSVGQALSDFLTSSPQSGQAAERASWRRWINIQLPNPSDQEALKRALDEAYPRSRVRTFADIVLIGVGGWLALTSISAIIQTLIQVWLEPHLK